MDYQIVENNSIKLDKKIEEKKRHILKVKY